MVCLFAIMLLAGPRAAGVLWWIVDPDRWDDSFGSLIWAILGLIFLPWFTLVFVLVAPTGVVTLLDAAVLVAALMLDFASLFGGYLRRQSMPGYSGY
jgi:hypothetical protein